MLFGIDDGGYLHVRDARSEGREWDRIGDVPVRTIAPASITGHGTALFAVGADGTLQHFARRNGRWRMQAFDARVPGDSPPQLISIVVMD